LNCREVEIAALTAQRDALKAACESALSRMVNDGYESHPGDYGDVVPNKLRAALALCKEKP
jgi:hypothetical protein